jgi:hypothetical protein
LSSGTGINSLFKFVLIQNSPRLSECFKLFYSEIQLNPIKMKDLIIKIALIVTPVLLLVFPVKAEDQPAND